MPNGSDVMCVDIPIVDDSISEEDEQFLVEISNQPSGVSVGIIGIANVVIKDDDGMLVNN